MTKKAVLIILLVVALMTPSLIAETNVFTLEGLNKPGRQVYTDDSHLYVIENFSIFLYSLEDFKLIKKFGKEGQGPQEFASNPQMGALAQLSLDVRSDQIIVKSLGKLSWFTKEGVFIKEQKLPTPFMIFFFPFGDNFVGHKYEAGNTRYNVLAAYNKKFEEIKELNRVEDSFQMGKGMKVLKVNPATAYSKDKLFMAWENEMKIKVFDTGFKELYTISHPIERKKVTDKDKKDIVHFLKTSADTKQYFEFFKPITFPDVYPAIGGMFVNDGKLYVLTFNSDDIDENTKRFEFLIMDLKGKMIKKVKVPIAMESPILPYPYTINKGKLYQIIENMDEETWEVHVNDIK